MEEAIRQRISELVAKNEVVLFMKGSRRFPQCGFSGKVVGILDELLPTYETVNVLADAAIRDGVKEFSSWPTIPQLYVRGAFVGGCDIVSEMSASGELAKLLNVASKTSAETSVSVNVSVSDAAKRAIESAGSPGEVLHLEVTETFQHDLFFGPPAAGEVIATSPNGLAIHMDAASARRASGVSIDWVALAGEDGGAFKIENPNEPPRVRPLRAVELKAMIDRGETFELYDVRPEPERAVAKLAFAKPFNPTTEDDILALDKATPLIFHCHHGVRSRVPAEHFAREGYRRVYNLEGGIDAWSASVDPTIPRY